MNTWLKLWNILSCNKRVVFLCEGILRAYSRQKSEKKTTKIWKIPEPPSPTLDRFSYNCMCNRKGDHGMTVRDEIRDIKHKKRTEKWNFVIRNQIHVHKIEEGDGKWEQRWKIPSLTTVTIHTDSKDIVHRQEKHRTSLHTKTKRRTLTCSSRLSTTHLFCHPRQQPRWFWLLVTSDFLKEELSPTVRLKLHVNVMILNSLSQLQTYTCLSPALKTHTLFKQSPAFFTHTKHTQTHSRCLTHNLSLTHSRIRHSPFLVLLQCKSWKSISRGKKKQNKEKNPPCPPPMKQSIFIFFV